MPEPVPLSPTPLPVMLFPEFPQLIALPSLPVYLVLLATVFLAAGLLLKWFLSRSTPERPGLYYKESPLNNHVLAKCDLENRTFSPSTWMSHRHIQTLLPVILPRSDVTYEREYLQMRDKGVVALDWVIQPHLKTKKRKGPVLLVIPSLTEGATSVSHVCKMAVSRGLRPVVFNRRGHGGSLLTTPKLQSFGDPSDLRQVIKYIRLVLPKSSIAAVAYGTGCGLLMSYLGEFGSSALLTVCACVSPCYDVPVRFSSRVTGLYDLLLLVRLKALVWRHAKALSSVLDIEKAVSAWSFSELDRTLYCPLYGYADLEQFWEMNNPIRDVDDIEVPVLCVNSLDDPTCSCADIPYDLFKCYPNFLLAVTKKGGHCGFLEGLPPESWADVLCLDYMDAVLEFTTTSSTKSPATPLQTKPPPHKQGVNPDRPRYHSISVGTGYHHRLHQLQQQQQQQRLYQRSYSSGKGRYVGQRLAPSNGINNNSTIGGSSSSVHSNGGGRCGSFSKKTSSQRFTI